MLSHISALSARLAVPGSHIKHSVQSSVLEPRCRYVEFRPCCSTRTV